MQSDRAGSTLLIVGTLGVLFVAAFHPTGHEIVAASDPQPIIRLNAIVHGVAIASVVLLITGSLGIGRWLGGSAWSTTAFAFFTLSGIASLSAATMSGFVAPEVFERLRTGDDRATLELLAWFSWRINQAFAQVHLAGTAVAILLWSVDILRQRHAPRPPGVLGILVALGILAAVLSGITLDVHAFGAIMLGQSAWLIWVAVLMRKPSP